jgi:predicted NAD/FAD-dependent oxidoreductase
MMHPRTSIAILGGGVSGLVLARTLADLGFERVVVFEREAQVGGKSCTVEIGGRPHDLGATMGVPLDYRRVLDFGAEAGIHTDPFPVEQHYSLARRREVLVHSWVELPRIVAQTAKYLALHRRTWRDGGLHLADPELHAPWSDVVARHGLEDVSERMLCYRTGYGYGFDDEVPAVMYASLIRPQTLLGLATKKPFVWRGGTQPIWTQLAARLGDRVEIRTHTEVTRITRDGAGAVVTSRRGSHTRTEHFDRLVIACDPQQVLHVLDASPAERRWFTQVRTYPYATVACEIEGLAPGRTSVGYVDENMRRDRAGHPMAWVKRYADQDIYICHLFAPDELTASEVARRIGEDVARLGGRLVRVHAMRRWRFFPHFTSAFMRAGGLAEIDRWQGQHATYLVGEVLSFATMARVAELAFDFAHRIAREPQRITMPAARLAS